MDVYEKENYIDIEYAVFACVHHACYTKQEYAIHGDISNIVDALMKKVKSDYSSTAYLLSVRLQDRYIYVSNVKKRQLDLWRRSQNQLA